MAKQIPSDRVKVRAVEPNSTESSEKPAAERLSVTLTKDGSGFDWDRMHGTTRERLRTILAKEAPATHTASAPAASVISPQLCGVLCDLLSQIDVAVAMKLYGVTREQARVVMFTADDKAVLTAPLQTVLNKYTSKALTQWEDEAVLLAVLSSVVMSKIVMLRATLADAPAPVKAPVLVVARSEPVAPFVGTTTTVSAERAE